MSKYNTIAYKIRDSDMENLPEGIGRWIEESTPYKSKWYSNMAVNISESILGKYIPSIHKVMSILKIGCIRGREEYCSILEYGTLATSKTCPGILNILRNCVLVKAPCDISITIDDTGEWRHRVPDSRFIKLEDAHPPEQFGTPFNKGAGLFDQDRVLKFSLPILLTSEEPYIHLDPQFHSTRPLRVINGVIAGSSTKGAPLNIITMFKIPDKGGILEIDISKGEVLAYLWSPSKIKLKEYAGEVKKLEMIHDRFINSHGSKL